jgi:hypothetical protein
MIRAVPYVDLPGILYALDRRARAHDRQVAMFVCAPDYEETHSGLANVLNALLPVRANARTWICEERWHLLGVAQTRQRPNTGSWDLVYLASMTAQELATAEVLLALLEYAVNTAIMSGMQRVFARTDDDPDILALFQRVGFQSYAHEMLYVRPSPEMPAGEEDHHLHVGSAPHLRRFHAHDAWALARLANAATPRRVQIAENLSSDEIAHQMVPRLRRWYVPWIEPRDESYVIDLGSHLAAWVRLRQGWAGVPHQLWFRTHPDNADLSPMLLRFALSRLCARGPLSGKRHQQTPVICHVRDYDGASIDMLRKYGFDHADTKAILVRHLTLRAYNERVLHGFDARVNYGVKGLGTVQSTPIHLTKEMVHALHDHRRPRSLARRAAPTPGSPGGRPPGAS